jgi:hypothetical protein
MSEVTDLVPMDFLGLDDALHRLTRKILGSESPRSGPESVPPSDSPRRREFVAAFAVRPWRARYSARESIGAAVTLGEFELCCRDPFSGCLMKLQSSELRYAAFLDEIIRGGFIRASACESLEWAEGRRALVRQKDFDRWLRKLNPRKVARGLFSRWLELQMRDAPKEKTKADYRTEATQKFGVSVRLFEQEWKDCIAKTGSNWNRAGRPRKNHPR